MTWTVIPTAVTGDIWTAGAQNTYVKDNLDTLFPYNTRCEIAYSGSSLSLSNASLSNLFTFLGSNFSNTAIRFLPLIYQRQYISSSTQWYQFIASTVTPTYSNAFPTSAVICCGEFYTDTSGGFTATLPYSYSKLPFIMVNSMSTIHLNSYAGGSISTITPTTLSIQAFPSTTSYGVWMTIGE